MATQTVEFEMVTGESGAAAKLFAAGSDTVVATASPTEATNRKGIYSAAFTDVAAGTYRLIGFGSDGTPLTDPLWVKLTLTTATFQAYVIPENVFAASASTDWTSNERAAIRTILGIPASGSTPESPSDGVLYDITTSLSGAAITVAGRVASGGTITAYIGDDFRVRSDTELSISVADVGGTLYTKWSSIGAANLYFGASREGAEVGAITGTIDSITAVGSGASQTCKLVVEITNCGSGLKPGTYEYQIEQRQTQGSDTDSFIEVNGSLILKRNSVA